MEVTRIADAGCRRFAVTVNFSKKYLPFLLRWYPMFWRLPQNCLAPSIRLHPVRYAWNAHLFPSLQLPCCWEEHSSGCRQSQASSFSDTRPPRTSSTSAAILFPNDSYLSDFLHPKSSFLESWTENPVLFLWIHAFSLGRVSIDTSPRERWPSVDHCMQSSIFSLALGLPFGCSSARGGVSKLSFTRREMLLTRFLFEEPDQHVFVSEQSRDSHFEQHLESTSTAMDLSCSDYSCWRYKSSKISLWLLVHWDDGCRSSIRPSKFHWCPRQIRPCRWSRSSMRPPFPWEDIVLFVQILLLKSPLLISWSPLAILEWRTSKFVSSVATVTHVFDVFSSAVDFAYSISSIEASVGHLAPEDTFLLNFLSQIRKFPKIQLGFEFEFFSILSLGSEFVHQSFELLHMNVKTFRCCLEITRTCSSERSVKMDKQAVTRCCRLGSTPSSKVTSSAAIPPLPVAADCLKLTERNFAPLSEELSFLLHVVIEDFCPSPSVLAFEWIRRGSGRPFVSDHCTSLLVQVCLVWNYISLLANIA